MIETPWELLFSTLGKLFNFVLPVGITFGAILVAVFGLPILVRAFKKLFS